MAKLTTKVDRLIADVEKLGGKWKPREQDRGHREADELLYRRVLDCLSRFRSLCISPWVALYDPYDHHVPLSRGKSVGERSRPYPQRLPRPDALDRMRALRSARSLQRRQAHGEIRRHEIARASARARQLPEGEIAEHPRSLPGQVRGGQPVLMCEAPASCRCSLPKGLLLACRRAKARVPPRRDKPQAARLAD